MLTQLFSLHTFVEDELPAKRFEGRIWDKVLGCIRVMCWRRENNIKTESEGLIEHLGDYAGEQGTYKLKARICVYLDEPWLKLTIYHEVESKDFEIVFVSFWRYFEESASDCI